jgi:hypothetical protein
MVHPAFTRQARKPPICRRSAIFEKWTLFQALKQELQM